MQLEDYTELIAEGVTHFIVSIRLLVAGAHCDLLLLVGISSDPVPYIEAASLHRTQSSHLASSFQFS